MRLHLLGAFLELGMEPLYVLAQRRTAMRLRVVAETLATLARCCTLYFLFQVRLLRFVHVQRPDCSRRRSVEHFRLRT